MTSAKLLRTNNSIPDCLQNYHASILSWIASHASSGVFLLLIPVLNTPSQRSTISLTPHVLFNASCNKTNKFACQSLYQMMQFNAMRAYKWVDDIDTIEVFFTLLFIYWLQGASCCNCKIIMIVSISSAEASSALRSEAIFWTALFLWIETREIPKQN